MSVKSSSLSASDSSPEDNTLYLTPSFIRDRSEKGWRAYFANTELMTASALFSQMNGADDTMSNQVNFLYDYYGMTEETRQEPPSPGHSPASNEDKDQVGGSSAIDIPAREELESPVMEMRHSFPEIGKSSMPYITNQSNETSNLSRRPHSASIPSINREKISPLTCQSCSSTTASTADTQSNEKTVFPHLQKSVFFTDENYTFTLEAQTSVVQKQGEDTLTYLNKGQFYFVSFEAQPSKLMRVKSVIHLVFRHEKEANTELVHWRYWYNQQPNPNQRAFDIDRKVCQNIDEEIEEVGYNALAFNWDPNVRAKVSLRINCLSTDFSSQKGVKGIPLHLQIDTYEDMSDNADPVHRAFCQIKVFRDKGAERKNKDESKAVGKRMVKYLKGEQSQTHVGTVFQMANKVTVLYSTSPIGSKSVIFVPKKEKTVKKPTETTTSVPVPPNNLFVQLRERENKRGFNAALSDAKDDLEHLDVYPKFKSPRFVRRKDPAVTIYVRKEEEKAYNALMLETLTLEELKQAVSVKYSIPIEMIKNVFKKTKKGILVNIDDQLVERFADEDDYIITIDFNNQLGHFEVIFNS